MATQWPLIVTKLVTVLPTLSGWASISVFDGRPTTAVSPDGYCTVGFVASSGNTDEHAGSYTKQQDPDGFQYAESGHVRSQITVTTGDPDDAAGQRAALFALCDALESSIRADRTLGGVLSPASTLELAVDVLVAGNVNGLGVSAVLTLTYYTVT